MRFFTRNLPPTEEGLQEFVTVLPGFQGTGTGYEMTQREALANSDIFTAIMMLSSDLAKMDMHEKRDGQRVRNSGIEALLNKRPNHLYDGYTFKLIVFANALLTKHGYVEIVRDKSGAPIELYHLETSKVRLVKQKNNRLVYRYNDTRNINYNDVIDYKPYTLDGFNGVSMIDTLKEDIDMQMSSKKFFTGFFRNGTQSGGKLKLKDGRLSKEARENIRQEFMKANSGVDNSGKVLVLDESMDYEKFEIDTEILKLINTSQHSTSQIAKVYGIPLHRFGIETPNMSLKDTMGDYLQSTLSKYMRGIISAFEFKLFGQSVRSLEFDTESFRKADWETYSKNLREDFKNGAITLNEYRQKIGEPRVDAEYADVHRMSLNLVSADLIDDYQKATMNNRLKGATIGDDETDET